MKFSFYTLSISNCNLTWIEVTAPALLAWSSQWTNKIRIVELGTEAEVADFDGVKLKKVVGILKFSFSLDSFLKTFPKGSDQAGLMSRRSQTQDSWFLFTTALAKLLI